MGNFKHHIIGAVASGAACAAGSHYIYHSKPEDTAAAFLLCIFGGILPDVDCSISKPSDLVIKITSVLVPVFVLQSFHSSEMTPSQILLLAAASYFVAAFGIRELIKRFTVHRGMFHSIPAALIWGGVVFLSFRHSPQKTQLIVSSSAVIGYLTHLLIDELFSLTDISGGKFTPKSSAGTAMKFISHSGFSNLITYAILAVIFYFCSIQYGLIH